MSFVAATTDLLRHPSILCRMPPLYLSGFHVDNGKCNLQQRKYEGRNKEKGDSMGCCRLSHLKHGLGFICPFSSRCHLADAHSHHPDHWECHRRHHRHLGGYIHRTDRTRRHHRHRYTARIHSNPEGKQPASQQRFPQKGLDKRFPPTVNTSFSLHCPFINTVNINLCTMQRFFVFKIHCTTRFLLSRQIRHEFVSFFFAVFLN